MFTQSVSSTSRRMVSCSRLLPPPPQALTHASCCSYHATIVFISYRYRFTSIRDFFIHGVSNPTTPQLGSGLLILLYSFFVSGNATPQRVPFGLFSPHRPAAWGAGGGLSCPLLGRGACPFPLPGTRVSPLVHPRRLLSVEWPLHTPRLHPWLHPYYIDVSPAPPCPLCLSSNAPYGNPDLDRSCQRSSSALLATRFSPALVFVAVPTVVR